MDRFELANKVAIVTGGGSGIGLQCAVKLLENGAKGLTVADISGNGQQVVEELQNKFGKEKVKFVKTDVSNYDEFERTFKETVAQFGNVDILINSAGMFNDRKWQKSIAVNVNGVINGMLLALENYIPKYKSGLEGIIVNVSSIMGIDPYPFSPIYAGSKFALHGMTLAWGSPDHFARTQVRVVGVCPGFTKTPFLNVATEQFVDPAYEAMLHNLKHLINKAQSSEQVALHMMEVIEKAPNGTLWVVEDGEAPYQYKIISRHDIEKQFL